MQAPSFARLTAPASLFLLSCTPIFYHRCDYDDAPAKEVQGVECEPAVVSTRNQPGVGFIEFDDVGQFWDPGQAKYVLDWVAREADSSPLLVVVFAHGWRNNASKTANNVVSFQETLQTFAEAETEARKVLGVYLGWRGKQWRGDNILSKGAETLTFFKRKRTAHRIGSTGAVTEVLWRLHEILEGAAQPGETPSRAGEQDQGVSSRLVTIGHSFGGALVFDAVKQSVVITGRPPGDAVLLINPAFEAARYEYFHGWAERHHRKKQGGDLVPLVVLVSKGDGLNKRWFPWGRRAGTFLGRNRPSRNPRMRDADPGGKGQGKRNVANVGFYKRKKKPPGEYFTHELIPDGRARAACLRPLEGREANPVWFVAVDSELVPKHAKIFGEEFMGVVRRLVRDPGRLVTEQGCPTGEVEG